MSACVTILCTLLSAAMYKCYECIIGHHVRVPNEVLVYQSVKTLFYFEFRARLHGGVGSQVGEVTHGGSPHLPCKHDQIKMRDYMDRRLTSSTWGPPPPYKQALKDIHIRESSAWGNITKGITFSLGMSSTNFYPC